MEHGDNITQHTLTRASDRAQFFAPCASCPHSDGHTRSGERARGRRGARKNTPCSGEVDRVGRGWLELDDKLLLSAAARACGAR